MPVNQFGGIHIDAPQLVTSLSFSTVKDYELHRASKAIPRVFDETMKPDAQGGMKDGLMPPKNLWVR